MAKVNPNKFELEGVFEKFQIDHAFVTDEQKENPGILALIIKDLLKERKQKTIPIEALDMMLKFMGKKK